MKRENLEMGMRIKTKVPMRAYYDEACIKSGSIGELTGIDCPYVTKRGTFCHVIFIRNGRRVFGAYRRNEIEISQV